MIFVNKIFWGLVFIVIGVLYILRNAFGLNFPIWGIIWPILIILIGVSILTRPRRHSNDHEVLFDEAEVEVTEKDRKYDTVFGKGTFDFRKMKPVEKVTRMEVNAVFSGVEMRISESQPILIRATGVFGGVKLPDGNTAAFGERIYATKAFKKDVPYIEVKASAVFGGIDVVSD